MTSFITKFFSRAFGSLPCPVAQRLTSPPLVSFPGNVWAAGVAGLVSRAKATKAVAGRHQEME
jgi:hypothetical protein